MTSLIFSINAVLPIFLIIIAGIVLRKTGIIDESFVSHSTKVVFRVGLPALIFRSVSKADFFSVLDQELLYAAIFVIIGMVLICVICYFIGSMFLKQKYSLGAFIQGVYRSNYVIIGYPILLNLFGEQEFAKVALMTAFLMPVLNVLAVIVLSLSSNQNKSYKKLFIDILKNPLIIAIFVSIIFSIGQIPLPAFVTITIDYFAQLATPLALIGIGAFFSLDQLKKKYKEALLATILKLIIFPTIFVTIAYLLGLRGTVLGIIFIVFGSPTSISSFVMAEAMDNDGDLAANIIIMTTLFASLTIFVGIYILKVIGAI